MRKRFLGLVLPAALLCALLLPGQVFAAPSFTVTIERDTCVAGAGKYHLGQGVLRVRIIEYGKSGATAFTWVAQVWHLPIRGKNKTWTKEHQWRTYSTTFNNDNASHYESRQFAYAPDHNAYHKIVLRVSAWNGTTRLYTKLVQGESC
jgi:hypothetical protein